MYRIKAETEVRMHTLLSHRLLDDAAMLAHEAHTGLRDGHWSDRSLRLLNAILPLVAYQEHLGPVDPAILRLESLEDFAHGDAYEKLHWVVAPLRKYLEILPGYRRKSARGGDPIDSVSVQQHGFSAMGVPCLREYLGQIVSDDALKAHRLAFVPLS